MALTLDYTTPQGDSVTGAYHKLVQVQYLNQGSSGPVAELYVSSYKDQAASDDGKAPYDTRSWRMDPFDPQAANIGTLCYDYLKTLDAFTGAVDA